MKSDLSAPPDWRRLAFVSDLHIGDDAPRTTARFIDWLGAGATGADALFVLGDLFEAWIGDDLLDAAAPGAEHAVCAALAAYAQAGRFIGVLHGNRDFLLGPCFAERTGVTLLPDPCVLDLGISRLVLTHGDALCTADHEYQAWRAVCRRPEWQAQALAQPLEQRRAQARALRAGSRAAQAAMDGSGDADPAEAAQWMDRAASQWMIHGHTHRPREHWEGGRLRQVLSDWDLDGTRPRAEVLWLERGNGRITVRREDLAGAT